MKNTLALANLIGQFTYMSMHHLAVASYEAGCLAREYWEDADGTAVLTAAFLELQKAAVLAYRKHVLKQKALPAAPLVEPDEQEVGTASPTFEPTKFIVDTLHYGMIMSATCKILQGWCRDRGLETAGKKSELQTRLLEYRSTAE
jgi:hypothetical protein